MKHLAFRFAVLAVALRILSTTAFATVVYVKWDSPGPTFDGTSWDTAFHTVQAGLNSATSGDEVWVARGTYEECITLALGVGLYGGFIATESLLTQRPSFPRTIPDPDETALDGRHLGPVVVSPAAATTSTRIDGFTIRNGVGTSPYDFLDGGIYCDSSSPTIANNTITQNSASGYGGGGICCYNSSPSIVNNIITANSASEVGGGIYCCGGSPTITNNMISGNTSYQSGGGICCFSSSPTIANNTITQNSASGSGGGGGISCYSCSPTITNNTISGNTSYQSGGGIYCEDSSPTIANNAIKGNNSSQSGGGIYFCDSEPLITPVVTNNTISKNSSAGDGAGVYCWLSRPAVTNNTFVYNHTPSDGGGFYCAASFPELSNNIIAFNSSGVCREDSALDLVANCFFGNQDYDCLGIIPGATNVCLDPLLVDQADDDYHLRIVSPCVNAGWNNAQALPAVDFEGEDRVLYGRVDIGADECSEVVGLLKEARMAANGVPVVLTNATVTASFPALLYIEAQDRSSGIRVEKAAHGIQIDDRADVIGSLRTNADGERYIEATAVSDAGSGTIAVMALTGKVLGGGNWFYSPTSGAGQKGVLGGLGLNNIGLLVRTWGRVTQKGHDDVRNEDYLYIDDGSGLRDGTSTGLAENVGVRVICDPAGYSSGEKVEVTGISSCFWRPSGIARRILTRRPEDVRKIVP